MFKGKTAGVLFLFALFSRLLLIFISPPGGTDHIMVHTAVNNLLRGNGLTFALADPNDISKVFYQPMCEWPPLAAYILSVLKAVTGSGKSADLIMMCVGMIFLLLVMRGIMACLKLGDVTRSILWIIVATNAEPFSRIGITDLYAGLFFLWGVLFCLRFLETTEHRTSRLLVAALFFFLPAAFRYQYYPLVFIFPAFLFFAGYTGNRKELMRSAKLSFSVVFFLVALQAALLVQNTGRAAFIADKVVGFYPENLLFHFPVLLKSVLAISYIENKVLVGAGAWFTMLYQLVIFLFTVLLIVFSAFSFFKYFRSQTVAAAHWGSEKQLQLSRFLLFVCCTAVFILLILLSLRYREQIHIYGKFTYVSEGRYYFAAMLLLPMLLASWITGAGFGFRGLMSRGQRVAYILLVVYNSSLFAKFLYNAASGSLKQRGREWIAEKETLLDKVERSTASCPFPVVIVETIKYFAYQPSFNRCSVLRDADFFTTGQIKTSQPVQLIFFTGIKPTRAQIAFITQNKAQSIHIGKKCRAYRVLIVPQHSLASL